ncbi:MAG: SPW repeat protein [Opitutaceae bacterium]|nr:SPW repeat protein [Opitutaceae bacterium]
MIPRNVHGVLDYVVGLLLLLAPSLLGFVEVEQARNAAYIAGVTTLVYSLLTSYEFGLLKLIPFGVHLTLDTIAGIFLIASPWLMGFADQVVVPHVLVGTLELVVVFLTRRSASRNPTTPAAHAP